MITNIKVVQNDANYDLNFTLQDSNGAAVDLTGGTILFKAVKENDTVLKVTGTMAIVSGPAGTCKYTVQAADFAESGRYVAEIQVTIGSREVTWNGISIIVTPDLP